MKKGILLVVIVAVVSGLVLWGKHEGAASGSSEKERQGIGELHKKEILLSEKFIDPELVLIDSRDGAKLQEVKASSLRNAKAADNIAGELEAEYDQAMIPARLGSNDTIKAGKSRIVLDKEGLMKELRNVKAFQRVINVKISETAPNVTAKTIANIDQSLVASFTTKFNPAVTGRTTNIGLASQEINNTILGPGDKFYFNRVVGERTVQKGYQKAMEIVNKELVEGIGGGICQVSSTLYNAIDRAGLGIIELHHHSKQVGYVPKDRDATVSYGGKDFKFLNNKSFPVLIKTIVNRQNGTIEVQVRASSQYAGKN